MRQDSLNCKGRLIVGSTREEKIRDYEKCMKEKNYVLKGEVKQEVPDAQEIERTRAESWDKGDLSDQVWVRFGNYHNDRNCPNMYSGGLHVSVQQTPAIVMTRGEAIRQGKVPCQWCVK
jgi:hypothetical protein